MESQELLEASDEEIIAAATDLGMNPLMKGSAAFAGLKYPSRPQLADFFELFQRPAQQAQFARLEALGLNVDSDLERSLGRRVVESLPDP